jgi:hypothetical protein
MAQHRVSASERVAAPSAQVYAILADYRESHPQILPRPPFTALVVEQGGWGAGTVITLHSRLFGLRQRLRGVVTEPEPGRVLVETYPERAMVTTFTVEPRTNGAESEVTITTDIPIHAGLLGRCEATLLTRFLCPLYERELEQLASFATQATSSR